MCLSGIVAVSKCNASDAVFACAPILNLKTHPSFNFDFSMCLWLMELHASQLFIKLLPKKAHEIWTKKSINDKTRYIATKLYQSREFYTNAVGAVGDIKKVCYATIRT